MPADPINVPTPSSANRPDLTAGSPVPRPTPATPPPPPDLVEQRPVVFGEVLFDCFEDGSEVLGGAAFNVAWHLKGLGLDPIFISRVGDDDRGRKARAAMQQWGLSDQGLQTDPSRPTGEVTIKLTDGQPTFDIRAEQAYDYIDAEAAREVVANQPVPLLYHGTLALRSEPSSQAAQAVQAAGAPTFLDLNLREPWWSEPAVSQRLSATRWLKLNDEELMLVTHRPVSDEDARRQACEQLFADHELGMILVTRGAKGAEGYQRDEPCVPVGSTPVENLVDPVGAGDAFSSVVLLGLIRKWPLEVILRRAVQFAAVICGLRGATTRDRTLYEKCGTMWSNDNGII